MLLKIEGLLSTAETASIRAALAGVKFDDGKVTAGAAVRDLKTNLQVAAQEQALEEPRRLFIAVLLLNRLVGGVYHRFVNRFLGDGLEVVRRRVSAAVAWEKCREHSI